MTRPRSPLLALTLFAVAMAYVEANLVVYLRAIYYPDDRLALFPLRWLSDVHWRIELAREGATLVMLAAAALLAGRDGKRVFAAFVYLFGLWDIFYYAWLKLLLGWPVHWLEWDVLFLVPWPWFAPWLAPALIALSFLLWGGGVLITDRDYRLNRRTVTLFACGAGLALMAFLAPALPLLTRGVEALNGFEPAAFAWPLFGAGYLMMTAGLVLALARTTGARR